MRKLSFSISVTAVSLLLCCAAFAQSTSIKPVKFVGTTKFKAGKASGTPLNKIVQGPEVDVTFDIPGISGNNSPARLPANFVPRPAGNAVGSGSFLGFKGLDQLLQAIAPTGAGQIVISDSGFGPDDGFNGRVGRWGDYSAAVSDEGGNIWMATEAINPPLIALPPGVLAANWGTFIAAVTP